MEKLLLVDGSNLLFQMFYGMPSRIVNSDGKAIHGTLGFVGALIKVIKMTAPTHIAVLFDGEHKNYRAELLPDYKANRTDFSNVPPEDSLYSQIVDVYNALSFMGICHAEITESEADDAIAALVSSLENEMQIVISSFDSDFFQLINENVTVLRYRGKKTVLCDTDYIKERLGIIPGQYADFKALTGDAADNIKGAEKVGPKTAARLLNQFGSLESIITGAGQIEKQSVRESVIRNADGLRLNFRLIKLSGNGSLAVFRRSAEIYLQRRDNR